MKRSRGTAGLDGPLTVGELAERAGITVRTLHHYDESGLLQPGSRSDSGYRLYGPAQIRRLQQILSLRELGFSLNEIRRLLEDSDYSAERVLEMHVAHLDRQAAEIARLRDRLTTIRAHLRERGEVSPEALLGAARATTMIDRHYTAKQRETLARRREAMGRDGMADASERWSDLMGRFADAMERGLTPDDPDVLDLARESRELVRAFTGGDPEMRASLAGMYREKGPDQVLSTAGMALPEGLWSYMQRAGTALGG